MNSQNVYDTLLPLFNGGNVSNEAQIQPLYSCNNGLNQSLSDVDVQDALGKERAENENKLEHYQNGWCRLYVVIDWLRHCLVALV